MQLASNRKRFEPSALPVWPWPDVRQDGWGVHPFVGALAHYWRRAPMVAMQAAPMDTSIVRASREVRTLCGRNANETREVPLLLAGSFPLCKRCAALERMRRARRAKGD